MSTNLSWRSLWKRGDLDSNYRYTCCRVFLSMSSFLAGTALAITVDFTHRHKLFHAILL
jgi:hypothetical protein